MSSTPRKDEIELKIRKYFLHRRGQLQKVTTLRQTEELFRHILYMIPPNDRVEHMLTVILFHQALSSYNQTFEQWMIKTTKWLNILKVQNIWKFTIKRGRLHGSLTTAPQLQSGPVNSPLNLKTTSVHSFSHQFHRVYHQHNFKHW